MVEVIYRNRLGNRLFQYCYGRIIAESLGWHLKCSPIPGFAGTSQPILGASHDGPMVACGDDSAQSPDAVASDMTPRHLVIRGWFQCYAYYFAHASRIRRWLAPAPTSVRLPDVRPNDFLLHLRLGRDYESKRWILDPEFYQRALERVSGVDRVYVCYDKREMVSNAIRRRCLEPFLDRGAILFKSSSPMEDFSFARRFRRIAIAASTFCWWAAYLSDAEEIFFPSLYTSTTSCWRGVRKDVSPVRLEVDEPRYNYIDARTLWD